MEPLVYLSWEWFVLTEAAKLALHCFFVNGEQHCFAVPVFSVQCKTEGLNWTVIERWNAAVGKSDNGAHPWLSFKTPTQWMKMLSGKKPSLGLPPSSWTLLKYQLPRICVHPWKLIVAVQQSPSTTILITRGWPPDSGESKC